MRLAEKPLPRSYHALDYDWTPLSRNLGWLSNAAYHFHWYVRRNSFVLISSVGYIRQRLLPTPFKVLGGSDKSFVDDLVASGYCKHESNLCVARCWGLSLVSMICSSLFSESRWVSSGILRITALPCCCLVIFFFSKLFSFFFEKKISDFFEIFFQVFFLKFFQNFFSFFFLIFFSPRPSDPFWFPGGVWVKIQKFQNFAKSSSKISRSLFFMSFPRIACTPDSKSLF